MIYTLTFNPAIDYVIRTETPAFGKINRASAEQILAGGKGINVSVVLKNLGVESTALGFTAGFTGAEIRRLIGLKGVKCDFIELPQGFSRINVKLKSDIETEINGIGPDIPEESMKELFNKLEKLSAGDILVLAGSIPRSLPDTVYNDIMKRLGGRGVRFAADASGKMLMNVPAQRPFLIKPNHHELGEIFGADIGGDKEKAAFYAGKLRGMGAENVLVSMAEYGAVLCASDGKVYTCGAPKGKVINSVGAGDSMVAGFLAGWIGSGSFEEALKWGAAAGSASAFSEFLAEKDEAEKLYGNISVQVI